MPIPFTCPHCGKSMTVDDTFAGQTGPCSGCRQAITIPAKASARPSSGAGMGTALGIGAACLLGCVLCAGIVGLLLAPLGFRGMIASRAASHNNLKQIALALHNYHDANGSFPPAVVKDASGKPLYSWRVLILPYIGQRSLFDRFDKTKAWDDPANLAVSNTMVDVFRSPLDDSLAASETSYFVLVGPPTAFPPDGKTRMAEITDGTSNTIAVVELNGISGSWAAPIDPSLGSIAPSIGPSPGQLNPNGSDLNLALCDGFVRSLPASTPSQTLQSLFTRNGGEVVQIPE